MTAVATPLTPRTATELAEPRPRFRDLLAAEWLKLWSLRSMRWAFAVGAVLLFLFNLNAARADYADWSHYSPQIRARFVPGWSAHDVFPNNSGIILMLLTSSLGALTVVGEYSTGLVRTSFAAVPARGSLLSARMAVVTGVMLVYGAALAGLSFWATQAVLSGRHAGISIGYPGAWRVVAGTALLAPVSALVGMGLGVLIRHAAATVVANVAVLLLLPNLLNDNHYLTALLDHALPMRAWQRLMEIGDVGFPPTEAFRYLNTSVTGAWIVFAAWPAAAITLALIAVRRRDL